MTSPAFWKSDRNEFFVFLFLLTLVLWIFRGILGGSHEPFISSLRDFEPWKSSMTASDRMRHETPFDDPTTQTYPWAVYAHDQMRKRDFPLWNFRMFSGTPFLGNRLTGLLDPFILIPVYFLKPIPALTVFYLTHLLIASWFMYLFLKSLGISRGIAVLGAVSYILQGAYIPWMGFIVADKAYLPMSFYYLNRILNRGDRPGLFGFVFSYYCLSVSSYPLMVVLTLYLFAAWVLFSKSDTFRESLKRLIGLSILMVLIYLIGAAQHLPMLEFFRLSLRALPEFKDELSSMTQLERLDSPLNLIAIFFPTIFGDHLKHATIQKPEFILAIYNHAYIGILAAFGFLLYPIVRSNRYAKFFFIVSVIGLIFLSFHKIYYFATLVLPGLRISTVKPDFLTLTSMIIVASFAIDFLISNLRTSEILQRKFIRIFSWIIGAIVGLCFVILASRIIPDFISPDDYDRLMDVFKGFIFIWCAGGTLYLHLKRNLNLKIVVPILIGITLLDLLPYHEHFNPLVHKNRVTFKTPGIEFLEREMQQNGPFRIFRDEKKILTPNTPMIFGLDEPGGFDSFLSAQYANYFRQIDSNMSVNSRTLRLPSNAMVYHEPFWDFLGIRFILSSEPMPELPSNWELRWDEDMYIYENPSWLPRFYLVNRIIPADSYDAAQKMSRAIEPSVEAVVEGINHSDIPPALLESDIASVRNNRIDIIKYSADNVRLLVYSETDSFLVFSDSYFPGWRAWIDNDEVNIYRTNGIIKGIVLPSGQHTVKFLYDPKSYKIGWVLAICGLVLLFVSQKFILRLMSSGTSG